MKMAQISSMKQLGTRNMNCVVEIMEWSNKMDLVAFATEKGEIIVQRLNWQRIVTFPAAGDEIKVKSLSWQTDEAILAAAYSNGTMALLDIEKEQQISQLHFDDEIKKVFFSKPICVADYRCPMAHEKQMNYSYYLPPPPDHNGDKNKKAEIHKNFTKGSPCFLVSILHPGKIVLMLLGSLKAGCIDLTQHVSNPDEFDVYDVRLSGDFNSLFALVKDGLQLKLLHFKNEVLEEYISPILHLAVECSNTLESKNYINETIQLMMEAWETVLLEMDNKLTKYANSQTEGALSADLLELLVFGFASTEIEEFLREELTEKGVKKLSTSVELSYSNIQNLVSKSLQTAAVSMFYFLDTVNGLAQLLYFFKPLIECEAAENALRACGSFMMKIMELQQVIDQSVYDMKLFFNWLCMITLRLRHQELTEDVKELTTQDVMYLAEYLNSFEDSIKKNKDGTTTKRKFNLEKVGQYFANQKLQQIFKNDPHDQWRTLLKRNKCLRNSKLTFPNDKKLSLIQQRDKLFKVLDVLFDKANQSISESFTLDTSILCSTLLNTSDDISNADIAKMIKSSFIADETTKKDIFVTTLNYEELLIMEFDNSCKKMKCSHITLKTNPTIELNTEGNFEKLQFVDMQVYNERLISLLLHSPENNDNPAQSYFLQYLIENAQNHGVEYELPIKDTLAFSLPARSIFETCECNSFKSLESNSTMLATSGKRKVSSILSDSQKKMTIFEMEIEEEEDEDETDVSHVSMLEISKESNIS